ncbi:polymorphic toxin-type HINT domain-containing protein [Tuwongella immobilis]|uniref:Intein C-terminal splicing domain-containing protein n=1 Tax=Tuwongella immobilis TaxID=692036 RepID=A0A6C2YH02_9BACT|nr:polymorphic toxin-type HINT domain-containing protein [Tuwongella immobilis]VIP00766.1 yd repeat-containing protein : YD repeat protein OS=Isosphaera pallida (strain ATCC 43644 / DSM 9630 / IS1B) GN=Isop_2419 PE=4 SV=1: PT-HINT [Tuwongella immobilis]VTR96950.1 yd repeat-containing protein : YD repeat protein OS=Isosphaera pallida (strain ATCC 43644 / DSM 9630 / IS1B) GN=Isop_2419 PE=4 SV=1: PT-HINT [Tuwongella immobilis]
MAGQLIETIAEHPFWVVGRGWTPVWELTIGDSLTTITGETVSVEGVHETDRRETVYNLRVSDFHTYFVGCDEWGFSVWAHNACFVVVQEGENVFRLYKAEGGGFRPLEKTFESLDAAKQAAGPGAKVFDAPLSGLSPTGKLVPPAEGGIELFERKVAQALNEEGNLVVVAGDKNLRSSLGIPAGKPAAENIALTERGGA